VKRPSDERLAQGSLLLLLVIIARTLLEYYRLRAARAVSGLEEFEPYLTGTFLAVTGTMLAMLYFFARRWRGVMITTGLTIVTLLVYKLIRINARG
jgi:hypothetical protein